MEMLLLFVLSIGLINALPSDYERILGGSSASEGKYPYMASVRTQQNQHFCGGSIIGFNWILTSANCVYKKKPTEIAVVVGTIKLKEGGSSYAVAQIITHPAFNADSKLNDIALLKTQQSISFTKYVQTTPIASAIATNTLSCVLTGWGMKKYPTNEYSNSLKYLKVKTIQLSKCQSALPNYPIYNTNICTYEKKGKGACEGDVGTPLVCDGIQHGVVSWGIPCAKGKPDVYTSVGAFRPWIRNITGF